MKHGVGPGVDPGVKHGVVKLGVKHGVKSYGFTKYYFRDAVFFCKKNFGLSVHSSSTCRFYSVKTTISQTL